MTQEISILLRLDAMGKTVYQRFRKLLYLHT